jgi:hypothetical protein
LNISPPTSFESNPFIAFDSDIRRYWHIAYSLIWANRIAFGASFPLCGESLARKILLGGTENWFVVDYSSYNTRGYQAADSCFDMFRRKGSAVCICARRFCSLRLSPPARSFSECTAVVVTFPARRLI